MSGRYGQILSRLLHTDRMKLSQQCPTSSGYDPPEHEGGYKIYKSVVLFAALPIIIALSTLQYLKSKSCERERLPFHKYEYLRRRTKRFPWGDGNKSAFHHPYYNALPDGYEDETEGENCD